MSLLDLTSVKTNSFAPIPEGKYLVVSDEAEIKSNKAGTGEMIAVKFRVIQGEHEGKMLFENYNIKHENQRAVEIALSKVKDFMLSAGAKSFVLNTATDLVGLKAVAVVKHRKDQNGETRASISYFKPVGDAPEPAKDFGDLPF